MAKVYISDISKQFYLFEDEKPKSDAVLISQCEFVGIYYNFFYYIIRALQHHIGFGIVADSLLNDLVVMRSKSS
jgi:inner membrane protein involved in colicin E2 resistance